MARPVQIFIEGMLAGGLALGLSRLVVGEAVGELDAVVREDGVDLEREGGEEALEEGGAGCSFAIGQDLEIDEAGGAIDGDIGIAATTAEGGEILHIHVDEAGGPGCGEAGRLDRRLGGFARDAVTLEAAMQGGARDIGSEAALHHFEDYRRGTGRAWS